MSRPPYPSLTGVFGELRGTRVGRVGGRCMKTTIRNYSANRNDMNARSRTMTRTQRASTSRCRTVSETRSGVIGRSKRYARNKRRCETRLTRKRWAVAGKRTRSETSTLSFRAGTQPPPVVLGFPWG